MKKWRVCLVLAILFVNSGIFSQEGGEGEEDIIIEGERPDDPRLGKPGQTTIVSGEELDSSGARTLSDYLQRIPGVKILSQGGILESATVSMRGSSGEQVLVIVDGEVLNDLWGGAVNLNAIPLGEIETIEIIKGSGSALYGEGALGGVLIITTKKSDVWSPNIRVEAAYGSFQTIAANITISGPLGSSGLFSGMFFCEGLSTGGSYSYGSSLGDTERNNNSGGTGSVSGEISWYPTISEDIIVSLKGSGQLVDRGVAGQMEFLTPDAHKREEKWNGTLTFSLQEFIPGKGQLRLGINKMYSHYTNPLESVDEYHDNLSASFKLNWQSHKEKQGEPFFAQLGLAGAFDSLDTSGLTNSSGTALNGEAEQSEGSAWASLSLSYGPFSLIPAVRLDLSRQLYIGHEKRDRQAFSWSLTSQLSLKNTAIKGSVQSSYHNPSFQDLFWPSGAFASGNPDLEPEKGIGTDGEISWNQYDFLTLNGAGFFQKTTDLIQWLPSSGGIWSPRNVGTVYQYGGEIELQGFISLGEWVFDYSAAYDWLRCINMDEKSVNFGNQLAYRPEHSGAMTLRLTAPKGSTLEITGTIQGKSYSNNANTKYFEPLFLLDASFFFQISPAWTLTLSGKNLTNDTYIDRLGYPVPGIEWTVKGGFHY